MANGSLQAFDREFRRHIERHTPALVAALRTMIAADPPPHVKELVFEIEPAWDSFPVTVAAMGDATDMVAQGGRAEVCFDPPFAGPLLQDAGELIPADAASELEGFAEDGGVGSFERGARVLAEWFGRCWHAAGGASFPRPASVGLHDGTEWYDLGERRWLSWAAPNRSPSTSSCRPGRRAVRSAAGDRSCDGFGGRGWHCWSWPGAPTGSRTGRPQWGQAGHRAGTGRS